MSRHKLLRHIMTGVILSGVFLIGCRAPGTAPPDTLTPAQARQIPISPTRPAAKSATPPVVATALPTPSTSPMAAVKWIDTHTHLAEHVGASGSAGQPACPSEECLDRAVVAMDKYGMQMALVMSPPSARAGSFEVETQLAEAAQSRPDRFAYLGGGSVLNPLIQQTAHLASVPTDLQQRFEKAAQRVIEVGAIGFGETAVLHLSLSESHPFEEAPPDSPLFLLLADIAAQHDVPIDIHLQAVLSDMPTPPQYNRLSTRNPETLHANIAAFERLLMHNEKARIVWAHVGWDNTGDMTVDLVRQLVEKHSNLYLQMTFHGDRLSLIHI